MNTAMLAAKVGVSTRTIQRWIKHFDLPYDKNENGHYVFTNHDYQIFCKIRDDVKKGMTFAEIKKKTPRRGIMKQMTKTMEQPIQLQLTSILERLEINEKKIEQKASDVVSYQLLQHRKEIEELQQKVEKLETYIQKLEQEKQEDKKQPLSSDSAANPPIGKRKRIGSFLFKPLF